MGEFGPPRAEERVTERQRRRETRKYGGVAAVTDQGRQDQDKQEAMR